MKRFEWRLQRVLDVKQKQEQVKRADLVRLTERISQMRGELFMQKRIVENLISDLSKEEPENRLDRQALFIAYSATNDAKIRKLEAGIQMLMEQQKEKKNELLAIKQFNEGLEKLRAEAEAEFVKEQEKREQKDLDEAASYRFACKTVAT